MTKLIVSLEQPNGDFVKVTNTDGEVVGDIGPFQPDWRFEGLRQIVWMLNKLGYATKGSEDEN